MPGINVTCNEARAANATSARVDPNLQFPWIGKSSRSGKVILFTHFDNGWFKGVMLCNSTGRKTPAGQMAETKKISNFVRQPNARVTYNA